MYQKIYVKELDMAKHKQIYRKKLPSLWRGRLLLLGMLDQMVQSYIMANSKRDVVITRSMAVATARALLKRYPNMVGSLDIENLHLAQNSFCRMGFNRRKTTSSKPHIPEGARNETELMFLCLLVKKVEEYLIPHSLILNFDQTPLKFVRAYSTTLTEQNSKQVCIAAGLEKCSVTATFTITFNGNFLGIQLIYGGKTERVY